LRVNEQNHAVYHGQGAFHFATKVGVAWGVNDVDVGALPTDSAVLGQNGNAAFTFNGVVVHDGVNDFFVSGKGTRLSQQLVDHGGFTVVNVGDDGNVADLFCHAKVFSKID
jgi:hypothetical protein